MPEKSKRKVSLESFEKQLIMNPNSMEEIQDNFKKVKKSLESFEK
jgi:hypothetical protein